MMLQAIRPMCWRRTQFALIAHLGLTDYDLGGYSLGARTTVRMLMKGATAGRVILSGMGCRGARRHRRRAATISRHILTQPRQA